jgi:hypothetical protein
MKKILVLLTLLFLIGCTTEESSTSKQCKGKVVKSVINVGNSANVYFTDGSHLRIWSIEFVYISYEKE